MAISPYRCRRLSPTGVAVTRSRSSRFVRRVAIVAVLLAVAVGGGWYYWLRHGAEKVAGPRRPPIPVSVVAAARQDVPIHVSGLGTVQALNTVPIHSQISGELVEITFKEGQHVKKGEVIAKIDPRLFQAAFDQAAAKKGQDEANLVSAEKDLARSKTLVAKSFETQQTVDQQQAKVDALKAGIAADAAAIESAKTQLDYTIITSPIDGRAGIRQIDIGNIIHATDTIPLVVLTQTQPSTAIFTLPETLLDPVRDAMGRGAVEVTALDQNNTRDLATGRLLLVDSLIDQATSTIRLKALFPNTDERLWPGEFINARVLLETRGNAVTVPSAAVQRGPQGLFVWVVGSDATAQMRPIKVGPPTDEITIVEAGVEVGDRVVSEGVYKLQPGAKVAVTPATPPTRAAAIPAAAKDAP
jgi:membrane fusion protein, multidrug efflux system